ncbi:hypothetical protein ONE63_000532 [Megalurothrips usitatus]|uniref:HAP1 N-terminal domain-containing protein n=1 Tax=Megalurothrips usitatus TaxID=439358 RepID=A0AAV7XYQ8_9NEOP|nr:hypothetical protein ONE63_000532 [Megalurothrips usitatus]
MGCAPVSSVADVCGSEDLPEVEIISLLHEQIPRYRLRADALTQFTGYENQDWYIPTPALKPAETALTPDQIRETLNYFREYLSGCRAGASSGGGGHPSASTRRGRVGGAGAVRVGGEPA